MPPRPEAKLSSAVRRTLRQLGCSVYCTDFGWRPTDRKRAASFTAGIPDLIVFGPFNRFAFVELKTKRGRLQVSQKRFQDRARNAGVPCLVWRSVEDAVEWFQSTGPDTRQKAEEGGA